ncbi:Acetophenone carboxylase gamma subunit [Paraburkholderia domus]|uniref:hydantoinase/oxoprolinase family protein n=1 Tax=Paraburkholderia domus TaxID=2793075 RepID=UPI001911B4A5|nr:hydantoinase/oxoprolinase family protein [Paraburkholderia domus]MBK5091413.1 hydantoinase/oxoprolinase family protein [Burkholderia sp. R-69927]CAE6935919.1 Acetophenone carboxylase gamma subunit [Paraburkholderia domus]
MIAQYIIGVDVGGTFTDLVATDTEGNVTFAKSPSTPTDQSIGVLEGLERLAEQLGTSLHGMLGATQRIVHGMTVATNALLERKGARTALLTTDGHRDILEMREGLKPERYNLAMVPPEPLVPRYLRLGVTERIRWDGTVSTPLDEVSLLAQIDLLKQHEVQAVAVCYLHAYRNPAHEQRTAELLRRHLPHAYISLSSEVLPQMKEYERVSTTVVNAYVGPAMQRYLSNLEQKLKEAGLRSPLYIILSHGGITSVEEAIRLSAGTALSGPAGGIAGTLACAGIANTPNLIPFDMGGTSTDISLVADGHAMLSSERGLAGERIALRSFDILSIASGGGSIARLDASGAFDVGPQSAGSWPGPVCYDRGGVEPTVTDANLMLGYLDADNFLGGRVKLNLPAMQEAMQQLGQKLELSGIDTAAGIVRLINIKMADGVRMMTLRRGVDPRHYALLSFGGAAGLHATDVARELGMPRVIVPTIASVLSAWGMLATDLRYEATRSHLVDLSQLDNVGLKAVFDEAESFARSRAGFVEGFAGTVRIERSAQMRYGEQIYEVDVSLSDVDVDVDFDDPDLVQGIIERFHERHEALYTYSSPGQEVVLVNVHVAIVGTVPRLVGNTRAPEALADSVKRRKKIFTEGDWVEVDVHAMERLSCGRKIAGPAVIEAETTTVILHRGDVADVTESGWLDIGVRQK